MIPVLLDLARNGEGRIIRMEALQTAAGVAGMGHPPSDDPDTEAAKTLLDRVEQWGTSPGRGSGGTPPPAGPAPRGPAVPQALHPSRHAVTSCRYPGSLHVQSPRWLSSR